jgi:lysophospholipase L1-like esterase
VTRLRTLSLNAVAVLGGTLLGLGLIEGGLRVLYPDLEPRTASIAQFWRHDDALGWSHVPNARGPFRAFGSETLVEINSTGFRDRERAYPREPGRYRMVVIGDSMVWGYGVQQAELFSAMLERRRPDIEAINLGVSGYGTDQELIVLQQHGLRYRPDLVVLVLSDNDFETNVQRTAFLVYSKPVFELSPAGTLRLENTPVPESRLWKRGMVALIRNLYSVNLAAAMYAEFRVGLDSRASAPKAGTRPPFPRDASEKITAALLLEANRVSREHGAEFLLVICDQVGLRGQEVEAYLRARGVRTLNLDPSFPRVEAGMLHVQDGSHWSVRGHEVVADALLTNLQTAGLFPIRRESPRGMEAVR